MTQQGKFLAWAGGALGLALLALAVDWFWVTDAERIEQVVLGLKEAVARSDADAALAYLTPEAQLVFRGQVTSGAATREYLRANLERTKFEILRVSHLQASAGRRSRRGTADFRTLVGGTHQSASILFNFGPMPLDWTLGFRETEPGVWKVERLNLTRAPRDMPRPPGA